MTAMRQGLDLDSLLRDLPMPLNAPTPTAPPQQATHLQLRMQAHRHALQHPVLLALESCRKQPTTPPPSSQRQSQRPSGAPHIVATGGRPPLDAPARARIASRPPPRERSTDKRRILQLCLGSAAFLTLSVIGSYLYYM